MVSCDAHGPFISRTDYVGLVAPEATTADRIAITSDARMAYVLQSCENNAYKLVGAAYVDEVIYGELVRGEAQFETVVLR